MKRLLILLVLVGIAVGGFYFYHSYRSGNYSLVNPFSYSTELRDKALAKLNVTISDDQYTQTFYVTAELEC